MKRILALALATALTMALGTTAIAAAPKLVSGSYKGKTAQKRNITVKVSTRKSACAKKKVGAPCILETTYRANYKCYDFLDKLTGSPSDIGTKLGAVAIKHNKVDTKFGDANDNVKFKITFRGRKASGSISENYTSQAGDDCYTEPPASGVVKFTLKR
jgi:hypothetical protein